MKKVYKYGLGFLIFFVVSYFLLRNLYGLFTPYNSFTAERDLQNGIVQKIVVGDPYMPEVYDMVANKYGFSYVYAGCLATNELLNGTRYYNEKVSDFLLNKHGEGFSVKYNQEIDSLINLRISQDEL